MTNETRNRIQTYEKALPGMKERVFAAMLLFLIAIITAVAATYAWLSISAAPEVTSINTTVTANGSLEIAMANGTGAAPGKSAEGDSTGAGKSVNLANITWGNLINLSDPSYGLSKVTLRPAALNGTSGLLTNPLYGVGYGPDGRVTTMVVGEDFAYVYYDTENERFLVDTDSNHLGIRAISTVKYENLEGDNTFQILYKEANTKLTTAKNNYLTITSRDTTTGEKYISSLEGLMQVYAQNILDKKPTSQLDVSDYVVNLYEMMSDLYENVMKVAGESYVQMANLLELMKGSGAADAGYTVDTLVTACRGNKLPDYIKNNIQSLKSFSDDYYQLQYYLDADKKNSLAYWANYKKDGGTVYWSNINSIITWACNINTATLDGNQLQGMSTGTAAGIVLGGGNHSAVLNDGAIKRVEQRIGANMSPNVTITVNYLGNHEIKAVMTTSAKDPFEMNTDIATVKSLNTGSFKGGTAVAQDTYALAVDLWLRSNAGSDATVLSKTVVSDDGKTTTVTDPVRSYLTLEGAVIYKKVESQDTITDANGDSQPAYTAKVSIAGQTQEFTVYERYGVYYIKNDDGSEQNFEDYIKQHGGNGANITYDPKMTEKTVVAGYKGANRIWTEEQLAPYVTGGTSSTQGGGSCYVFYANNEADQSRFLELLGSMRVAFVDSNGRLIGHAVMDTEHYYAENGKVTVPLALDKTSAIDLGVDSGNTENSDRIYGLMPLTKNAATRVTAIVYLDGTKLTNQMVLATGDIQGRLNIQFSSHLAEKVTETTVDENGNTVTNVSYKHYDPNEAIKDEPLMDDTVSVSASVTEDSFTYDKNNPAKTTLNAVVEGVTPKTVSARFIRAISSTQGVLQDEVMLSGNGNNWSGEVTFEKPGVYVLRSLWVDGVEYDLSHEPISVTVVGSSVNSLTCDALTGRIMRRTVMTAEQSFSTNMTLGFTSSDAPPSRVNGIFLDENGRQVNVAFVLKDGVWTGTATFDSSGTYTMRYVEIDGDQYSISENLQPTLELLLGLKTETTVSATAETIQNLKKANADAMPTRFVLDPAKIGLKEVSLIVSTKIYDNTGKQITGLDGVKLYYGRAGSTVLSRGLNGDLTWDSSTRAYVGSFLVTEAGTYSFNKVTVEIMGAVSTISANISAPDIQAMPPDDASYFNNYTDTYLYNPNKDAVMSVGLAYSNAATKVEATLLSSSGKSFVVEGVMGSEAPDQGDKTVNIWNFTVPADESTGLQEGEWKLSSVTMYGIYYNGVLYSDNGAVIDLSGENIRAKVVNNLYITLSADSNNNLSGDFMTDHKINNMTVSVVDYEGKAIENHEVSDVKIVYYLNESNLADFGYSTDKTNTTVSGEGTFDAASSVYKISEMNFLQAGQYLNCTVSFALDGKTVNASEAGEGGFILKYASTAGKASERPTYTVKWNAPDAYVSYIKQPSSVSGCNVSYTETSGSQITDPYNISVWWLRDSSNWNYPFVGLRVLSLGSYTSGATIDLVLEGALGNAMGTTHTKKFTFNNNGTSNNVSIGKIEGDSGDDASSGTRGNDQWRSKVNVLDSVQIKVASNTFILNLKKSVTINTTTKNG